VPHPVQKKYQAIMDGVTEGEVSRVIRADVIPSSGEKHGEVINRVSSAFLCTPYQADALIGGSDTTEALVAVLDCVNCVTLVDHIEVLTRSHDEKTFLHNLAEVRCIWGSVDYLNRRHLFSTGSPHCRACP